MDVDAQVLCEVAKALVVQAFETVALLVRGALAGTGLVVIFSPAAHVEYGLAVRIGCGGGFCFCRGSPRRSEGVCRVCQHNCFGDSRVHVSVYSLQHNTSQNLRCPAWQQVGKVKRAAWLDELHPTIRSEMGPDPTTFVAGTPFLRPSNFVGPVSRWPRVPPWHVVGSGPTRTV